MKKTAACLLAALAAACASTPPEPSRAPAAPVDRVAIVQAERGIGLIDYYFHGTWHSVKRDDGLNDPRPMALHLVRLWPERGDGIWYYWEIVDPQDPHKVIRQRIVRYAHDGPRLFAENYRVPGGVARIGEWRKEKPFADVDPASLEIFPGCNEEVLPQFDFAFAIKTVGAGCKGDFPRELHERFEYLLSPNNIQLWMRLEDGTGKLANSQPEGAALLRKDTDKLL